jgi:hypothetical protein
MADDGYERWARNSETGEPIPPRAQPDTYPYPRGGMRPERDEPEPWEVEEERHAWEASAASAPIVHERAAGLSRYQAASGQGRSH